MAQRLKLHAILVELLGSSHVYFQPPADVKMEYPAIVYSRDDVATQYADNQPYRSRERWELTIIDRNPDSVIPSKVASLPMCAFSRHFKADNLNHDVYTLYF